MTHEARGLEPRELESWVGWCCSYCAASLEIRGHGLYCGAEGRWFASQDGIHRLLPAERRREIAAFLELEQRARRDEGWRAGPGLPQVPPDHPHAAVWGARARRFREAVALAAARLGPPPWSVLEAGAGCAWAGAQLLAQGHRVVAVDVDLDPEGGLRAADVLIPEGASLPRAEAEMEALPMEAGRFDLVLAVASLHRAPRLMRTLVELRRVTRRGGLLLVLESPVYRRREDGEAAVARRMRERERRYRIAIPRESQPGYLVLGELRGLFASAGWSLEVHGWPGRGREWAHDAMEIARRGRRSARFPVLTAKRDG